MSNGVNVDIDARGNLVGFDIDTGTPPRLWLDSSLSADREDLSPADRQVLTRLVAAIKKEERNR